MDQAHVRSGKHQSNKQFKHAYHVLETFVDGVVAAVIEIDLGAMDSHRAFSGNARCHSLRLLYYLLL